MMYTVTVSVECDKTGLTEIKKYQQYAEHESDASDIVTDALVDSGVDFTVEGVE